MLLQRQRKKTTSTGVLVIKKYSATLLAFLLGSGTFHSALADDTEIFAGGAISGTVIPANILFVLDNSGSMVNRLGTSNKTRIEALKEAFSNIIYSAEPSINAGLMRFHNINRKDKDGNYYIYDDDPLYYPVTNIDTDLSDDARQQFPRLESSEDDAVEDQNGLVNTDQDSIKFGTETTHHLSLPYTGHRFQWYSSIQYRSDLYIGPHARNAFRFEGLNIPENATIESATVEISTGNPSGFESSAMTVNAAFDNRLNSPVLTNQNSNISSRPTTSGINWRIGEYHLGDGVFSTPDLSQQLQELKGNAALNHATFIIGEGSSSPGLFADRNNSDQATPILKVIYSIPEDSANSYTAGLRFSNVTVPQGASILSASLQVVPTRDFVDTPTFNIRTESHSPAPFDTVSNNITSRTLSDATQWTAAPWDKMNDSGDLNRYNIDVTSLVSDAVSDENWCGGNPLAFVLGPDDSSTGVRAFSSFGSGAPAPELNIQYSSSSSSGCNSLTLQRSIQAGSDDAQYKETSNGIKYTSLTANTLNLVESIAGLRFTNIPVAKDTPLEMIEDVYLEFTASSDDDTQLELRFKIQNNANPGTFNQNQNSVKGRNSNVPSLDWTIDEPWEAGGTYRTPNLKSIFANALSHDNWQAGNAMAFLTIPQNASGGYRRIHSYNGSSGLAPRLVMKIRDQYFDNSANYKVRDDLVAAVQALGVGANTPSIGRLLQAKDYFSGSQTPITDSCQSNNIIFLSDGRPNGLSNDHIDAVRSLDGVNDNECTNNTNCGVSLTSWMYNNDLLSDANDPQGKDSVSTYTIGFGVHSNGAAENFLKAIASPADETGATHYYTADSVTELTQAFSNIFRDILSKEASFVSPSISVNQYQSYQHNNALYYGLFTPSDKINWHGNLKKYQLGVTYHTVDGVQVPEYHLVDSSNPPQRAVDDSGSFAEGTRSFWSSEDDGGITELGGAASNLPDPENRLVFTDVGLDDSDALSESPVNIDNDAITTELLGLNDGQTVQRSNIISWARGMNPATNTPRQQLGDPLHSEPALVTYGCTSYLDNNDYSKGCANEDSQDISLFFGTNQGFLHAISGNNGVEHFAYVPEELLVNLKSYWANPDISTATPKPYGIDGSPAIWRIDNNDNGTIESSNGDRVYLYVGLRRGGTSYLALDITDRNNPKRLWKVDNTTTGFAELGQSWSKPALTNIAVAGNVRKVLVFGGGYDTANDAANQVREHDSAGNALFIVDALTGDLLWKATNTAGTNEDPVIAGQYGSLVLDKMNYSIPGNIRAIDRDFDGVMEQMVFADMGGQVWRLFVDIDTSASSGSDGSAEELVIIPFGGTDTNDARGVVADLTNSTTANNNRRFYSEPVTGVTYAGNRKLFTIGIGSGYRAHPLNTTVVDRFYALKSTAINHNTSSTPTLTESDLYNATSNDASSDNANLQETALLQLALTPVNSAGERDTDSGGNPLPMLENGGWYIVMNNNGEKILSDISLRDGLFSFVSYTPGATTNSCNPVTGMNRFYRIHASDGTGLDGERYMEVPNTGIVSGTQFITTPKSSIPGQNTNDTGGHITQECVGSMCFDTASNNTIILGGWIDEAITPPPPPVEEE